MLMNKFISYNKKAKTTLAKSNEILGMNAIYLLLTFNIKLVKTGKMLNK